MVPTTKPLYALTAADLMSQSLVLIPHEMSICGAAHLLSQARVSGAPVVNERGQCVGVLSGMDYVHLAEKGRNGLSRKGGNPAEMLKPWAIAEEDCTENDLVTRFMTADPVVVSPGTSIGELAQIMIDVHIHRVIVTNDDKQPLGIVTSTDILAALARDFQLQALNEEPDMEEVQESMHLAEPVDTSFFAFG